MQRNIYICDRKRECNGSEICGTLCRYTTEPEHEDPEKKDRITGIEWIPSSEGLPEAGTGEYYFVTIREKINDRYFYRVDYAELTLTITEKKNISKWVTFNDWDEGQPLEVIAWAELPEPYKEGDKDDTI